MTTSPPRTTTAPPTLRHGAIEDAFGLLVGTLVVALGVHLLHSVHAVTGGTAGLALLLSYLVGWPFAVLYPLVTAPFLALAWRLKGRAFALRTLAMLVLVSVFTELHRLLLPVLPASDVYAIAIGNLLAGLGMLIVFRHRASLGGFNTVALIVQERYGWRAGNVQLAMDSLVLLAGLTVLPVQMVLWSAAGTVLLSLVLTVNHRPDRYLGY